MVSLFLRRCARYIWKTSNPAPQGSKNGYPFNSKFAKWIYTQTSDRCTFVSACRNVFDAFPIQITDKCFRVINLQNVAQGLRLLWDSLCGPAGKSNGAEKIYLYSYLLTEANRNTCNVQLFLYHEVEYRITWTPTIRLSSIVPPKFLMVLLETSKHHWLIKTSMMLSERCASGISFIRLLGHVTMTVRATGSFIHTLCRRTVRNEAVYQIWNGPCNTSISLFQVSKVSWSLSVSSSWKGSPERTPKCHSATIAKSKG